MAGRAPHGVRRGRLVEPMAALWLELQGMELLDRNRRAGEGEIDLIARDGPRLVFVEVRLRAEWARVPAGLSIGPRKQRRLRSCARALLRAGALPRWPDQRFRFDAILVEARPDGLSLRHLQGILD